MERAIQDLGAGVAFLREQGYAKVLLIGNSGGAALSSFYAAQSQRITATEFVHGGPTHLVSADLPAVDGLALCAAHEGRSRLLARWIDPTVIDELYAAGASLVIPEEFETSIEIFTAVLHEYHVPNNVIDAQVTVLRQERYSLLRGRKLSREVIEQLDAVLTQGTTEAVVLLHHSPAVGRTLRDAMSSKAAS